MIWQGTTPTIEVTTDIDLSEFPAVVLTIADTTGNTLDFDETQLVRDSTELSLQLTQAQTFLLSPGRVYVQIRAVDSVGNAIISNVMTTRLEKPLKSGVIAI